MQTEHAMSQSEVDKISVSVPEDDTLQHLFTYHPATDETIPKFKAIRDAGLAMARVIMDECPNGADKSAAIRQVREAVMTANAAIAVYRK